MESLEPNALELDSNIFRENIRVVLTLDRHDPYLEVRFHLQTWTHHECDRCLTEFRAELNARSPMLYVLGTGAKVPTMDDADIIYIPAGTTDLDVSDELRDFLILALPGKWLCSEDCRGICPGCGADLNRQPCSCNLS
ncbi:MAG: DUF177 domain-containing protein [bacterium]|nr:DUF177 domain-containing protein [bacterium]